MDCPLAVFTPYVGARSETFIRRHCQDLLPGRTVVLGSVGRGSFEADWTVTGPVLDLGLPTHRGFQSVLQHAHKIPLLRHLHTLDPARRFLWKYGVQVMMGEYLVASLPWLEVAHSLDIRFFAHAHGYDVSTRLREPRWQAEYLRYNQAEGVITMSEHSRARLVDVGLAPDRVHVVPYGIDIPAEVQSRPERSTVRCLAVGRLVTKKAPTLTLEAFRRACEAHPSLRLDYIGSGELMAKASQYVLDHGLQDKVVLHGSQPNRVVRRMMSDADIFLQHSIVDPATGDEEGLPVAILEAMAHALPVVSTQHAGIPEAVVHGSTGYLVAEGDCEGMAAWIVTLSGDYALRGRLGNAGWARARSYYSWEQERATLLGILGISAENAT